MRTIIKYTESATCTLHYLCNYPLQPSSIQCWGLSQWPLGNEPSICLNHHTMAYCLLYIIVKMNKLGKQCPFWGLRTHSKIETWIAWYRFSFSGFLHQFFDGIFHSGESFGRLRGFCLEGKWNDFKMKFCFAPFLKLQTNTIKVMKKKYKEAK